MNDTLSFKLGGFVVPTGLLLFLFFMCFLVWLFMRSKTGMAMSAAGSNPMFAKAAGINVNKMRLIGTTLSTVLAAVGIIVYAQGFGFMQLYNGPMMMGFNSVAAVLIGGASPKRASISHVHCFQTASYLCYTGAVYTYCSQFLFSAFPDYTGASRYGPELWYRYRSYGSPGGNFFDYLLGIYRYCRLYADRSAGYPYRGFLRLPGW